MGHTPSQPNQKRRAVLRGSLAAPVVLTVSSPTAAQVTSFGKCLANIGTQQPGKFFENSADNWLRTPITVEQFRKNANTYAWFYDDPKDGYVNVADLTKLPNGWHKVDMVAPQQRWALVWVDSQSGKQWNLIQVQRPLSGYQFTTMSCNASVNPTIKNG